MRKLVYFIILIIGLSTYLNAFSIKVEVDNLRNSKGVVLFALYNRDGTIPDEDYNKYYKKQIGNIADKSSSIVFENIPQGRYAINIIHDENKNGKIDKGFILPIEGIGFSNYTSIGLTHKPNFKAASFKLKSDTEKNIKIIYF
jgi:uncharacterized protein (DUF2141 family)